MTREHNASGST